MQLITISREYGAGGSELGVLLGERMGWRVLDHELVQPARRPAQLRGGRSRGHGRACAQLPGALGGRGRGDRTRITGHSAPWTTDPDVSRPPHARCCSRRPATSAHRGGPRGQLPVPRSGRRAPDAGDRPVRCPGPARGPADRRHPQAAADVRRRDADRQQYLQRYYHSNVNDPCDYDLQINTGTVPLEAAARLVLALLRPDPPGPDRPTSRTSMTAEPARLDAVHRSAAGRRRRGSGRVRQPLSLAHPARADHRGDHGGARHHHHQRRAAADGGESRRDAAGDQLGQHRLHPLQRRRAADDRVLHRARSAGSATSRPRSSSSSSPRSSAAPRTRSAELVVWRIIQGAGGAALLSTAQATLRQIFPREQQGMVQAIFLLGIIVAPTLGPTLGGWITDNYYVELVLLHQRADRHRGGVPGEHLPAGSARPGARRGQVDWLGIGLLTVGRRLAAVRARGRATARTGSPTPVIAPPRHRSRASASSTMVWWELSPRNRHPVVDFRVLKNRELAASIFLFVALGFGLYGGVFIFPLFTQSILRLHADGDRPGDDARRASRRRSRRSSAAACSTAPKPLVDPRDPDRDRRGALRGLDVGPGPPDDDGRRGGCPRWR